MPDHGEACARSRGATPSFFALLVYHNSICHTNCNLGGCTFSILTFGTHTGRYETGKMQKNKAAKQFNWPRKLHRTEDG